VSAPGEPNLDEPEWCEDGDDDRDFDTVIGDLADNRIEVALYDGGF
jgi:hypothetical protein